MNSILKIFLKTISNLITILALILIFLLAGIKVFGYELYSVLSPSMEPSYHVGSIVYVKKVEQEEIKKEDTITFHLSKNTIVTHRVKEIIKEGNKTYYRTKGDANDDYDAKLITYENIIGEVKFSIPMLGYISNFIQHRPGNIIAISIGIILVILVITLDLLTDNKKEKKSKKTEVKNEEEGSNNN